MAGFDMKHFLGPCSGLPGHGEEFLELAVADHGEDALEFLGKNDLVTASGRGLLEMGNWGSVDVSLLLGPAHGPLECPAGISL